jgi:hypothetical protein
MVTNKTIDAQHYNSPVILFTQLQKKDDIFGVVPL